MPRCSDLNRYDDCLALFQGWTTEPSGNALILRHEIRFGRIQRFRDNLIGWPAAGFHMG